MLSDDYLQYVINMDPFSLEDLIEKFGQDVWNFAYFLTKNRWDTPSSSDKGVRYGVSDGSPDSWLLTLWRYSDGVNPVFLRKICEKWRMSGYPTRSEM
jgi:hypothetical protein